MIALYILLGIIALILLLLLIPVRIYLRYENELFLNLRYAFLKFHLYPPEDKKEEEEDKKFEEDAKKDEKKVKKSVKDIFQVDGVTDGIDLVIHIVKISTGLLEDVVKNVTIKKLYLNMPVNGEDAGDVAISYGRTSGIVYSLYGLVLSKFKKVKVKSFFIYPNFNHIEDKTKVSMILKGTPIKIIVPLIKALIIYYKYDGDRKSAKMQKFKGENNQNEHNSKVGG